MIAMFSNTCRMIRALKLQKKIAHNNWKNYNYNTILPTFICSLMGYSVNRVDVSI